MGRRLTLPEGLYISVSQIKTWLRCPRSYVLHYVRGVEAAFVPTALAFGTAFHEAAAALYLEAKNTGEPLRLAYVQDVFRDAWDRASSGPVPLQADEDGEDDSGALTDKGIAMLGVFHEFATEALAHQVVESVEQAFAVSIFDPDSGEVLEEQLVGTVDLVVREDERRVVVEHKTAARRYGADQLRFDIQPTAYKLAARLGGLGEVGVRYQVVTKAKTPALQVEDVVRGEQHEDDLLRTALGVLRSIDAGVDFPLRGAQCRTCPYAHGCKGAS
ncbi:PD-(D/E)XK nuclease family protein [Anaeromyxobacter sp. SG26]|uniref:PD-(D/E)XK nuclease family protein n=1 Tax=Anaeromyxobacter sp. SG26 TaxID=2925407 RepID=UPI001F5965FF|nr:PD-(D/E)XK nuclease family protein [Anaeromyxobacter sp. SG26]